MSVANEAKQGKGRENTHRIIWVRGEYANQSKDKEDPVLSFVETLPSSDGSLTTPPTLLAANDHSSRPTTTAGITSSLAILPLPSIALIQNLLLLLLLLLLRCRLSGSLLGLLPCRVLLYGRTRTYIQTPIDDLWDRLDLRSQLLFNPIKIEPVFVRDEVDRQSQVTKASRTTDTMKVGL